MQPRQTLPWQKPVQQYGSTEGCCCCCCTVYIQVCFRKNSWERADYPQICSCCLQDGTKAGQERGLLQSWDIKVLSSLVSSCLQTGCGVLPFNLECVCAHWCPWWGRLCQKQNCLYRVAEVHLLCQPKSARCPFLFRNKEGLFVFGPLTLFSMSFLWRDGGGLFLSLLYWHYRVHFIWIFELSASIFTVI